VTSTHRLSLPAHGAAELLVGLALLALPFALGLNAAALVIGAGAGVVVAGVGLAGGESLSVRAHLALDQAVVAVLAGAALALALAGERPAALLLGVGALAECALVAGTRWSRRG
jgi:predicted TIM-barrel enzyme